jgi:hypothetical protein
MPTTRTPAIPAADDARPSRHDVEHSVLVNLTLDGGRWVIDRRYTLGERLASTDAPSNVECRCGDPAGCRAVLTESADVPLPTAEELYELLGDAIAFTQEPETAEARA